MWLPHSNAAELPYPRETRSFLFSWAIKSVSQLSSFLLGFDHLACPRVDTSPRALELARRGCSCKQNFHLFILCPCLCEGRGQVCFCYQGSKHLTLLGYFVACLTGLQVGCSLFSTELSWLWHFSSDSSKGSDLTVVFFFPFFLSFFSPFPRHAAQGENLGHLKHLGKCAFKYHNIK